ncbi:MAG: dihydrolipoyl dehydrogenase [Planctomycetota bacterium]
MADLPSSFDLIVIGAGPGGYVAAIKAAQLGLTVACVEKQYLGGTCLNVGCIPSKALLDSSERYASAKHDLGSRGIDVGDIKLDMGKMMNFKEDVVGKMTSGIGFLFKKNKVTHLKGVGKIVKGKNGHAVEVDGKTYDTKNILVATGSKPNELPNLKYDEEFICSSTGALEIPEVPEKMLIVGGGYIGVEIGSVWNRLGSEVTIVEFADRILPASDKEAAEGLFKSLKKQGIKFHLGSAVESATVKGKKVEVVFKPKGGGEATTVTVDRVMVSVGRAPVTEGLGLEDVGGAVNERGFVEVDDHFQVKGTQGIYAIGDVIGKIMLAHNSEHEGKAVAEFLAKGTQPHVNYPACPAVVYTHPELASVGMTQEEAKESGRNIKVGKFPLTANGRARGMGETEGFVKVIGDADTDKLLGVHILSPHASDMIGEAVMAVEFAASVEDVARAFHAHPTLPEAIKEAAMAADKHAIHI